MSDSLPSSSFPHAGRPVALVIEDDDQIAYLLQFILHREGFEARVVRDGRAAQRLIQEMQPPAVVILDLMLPYVDGMQLLFQMRAQARWIGQPVLVLSAKSQEKDIVRALDAGANDYMVKPFKAEELRARIRRLLTRES